MTKEELLQNIEDQKSKNTGRVGVKIPERQEKLKKYQR